ncbi:MAG: hypothetical protein JXA82_18690 [Sedimentisphaerales bacterium]|nr:hypothetical protein [Sedimentisphaerales bacterium]
MIMSGDGYKWPSKRMTIWRYIDFAKYVEMINSKTLFFSSHFMMDDPYEGSFQEFFLDFNTTGKDTMGEMIRKSLESKRELIKNLGTAFLNCWHMNSNESAAFWEIYMKSGYGIAIKSTFGRLQTALQPTPLVIHLAKVIYGHEKVDDDIYKRKKTGLHSSVSFTRAIITKRKDFKHEKELRAIIFPFEKINKPTCENDLAGINVQVDLKKLIQAIYVNPLAPNWFKPLVEAVTKEYNIDCQVVQSQLYKRPYF